MFCPKCKSEYKEGVRQCYDCGVPLVDVIPPEPKVRDLEYVSILETFNWGDIAMIESVLEGSGIDYLIQGERALYVVQYVEPVTVLVVKEQVDEAKELLKDLDLSFKAISTTEEEASEVENGEDET
ncbi:MAG: DUF2007 domain-containing protein [Candidatus Krumholzibacteriaceae bacterium]|jgi:hypothetical protein